MLYIHYENRVRACASGVGGGGCGGDGCETKAARDSLLPFQPKTIIVCIRGTSSDDERANTYSI